MVKADGLPPKSGKMVMDVALKYNVKGQWCAAFCASAVVLG